VKHVLLIVGSIGQLRKLHKTKYKQTYTGALGKTPISMGEKKIEKSIKSRKLVNKN
jgi:hypothetical protein